MDPILRSVPEGHEPTKNPNAKSAASRAPQRPRPKRALPTDRMKFETQVKALRSFATASRGGVDPVSSDDIAKYLNVAANTAGLNNIFFLECGLITREAKGRYKPVPAVVEFQRQSSFGTPNAPQHLASLFAQTWFYEEARRRDELGAMSRSDLVTTLASAAKADSSFTDQLDTLVQWLEFVGLITFQGDAVVVQAPTLLASSIDDAGDGGDGGPGDTIEEVATPAVAKGEKPTAPSRAPARPILSFSLVVNLTAEDMDKLSGPQVASLFAGVGQVAAIQAALRSKES